MADEKYPLVVLAPVDDVAIEQLVHAATSDASADEVTPPLTDGGAWTAERMAWLRNFQGQRRAGLDGPAGEATWAVVATKGSSDQSG